MNAGARVGMLVSSALVAVFSLSIATTTGAQDPQSVPAAKTNPEKPKKVWTNDDVPAAATAPEGDGKSVGAVPKAGAAKAPAANRRDTGALRDRLHKLEAQLKDTEAQLEELKKFEAGETNGSAARDARRGVNRASIPEQIRKLETKRADLKAQIGAIYDEARHSGIAPGDLR